MTLRRPTQVRKRCSARPSLPRRSEFVLVSKCGQSFDGLPGEAWSPEVITATVDRSLARLNTDHLDVMLLHSCSQDVLERGEALGALVKARSGGKDPVCRVLRRQRDGRVCGDAAGRRRPANVDQHRGPGKHVAGLLPTAIERGLGVIAKRPVANAAWKPLDEQEGMYKDYAKDYHARFKAMGLSLSDFDVQDWGELALRFTISLAGVHTGIIGTTKIENARRNLAAAEKGPLPQESVDTIRAAFDKAGGTAWPALQ